MNKENRKSNYSKYEYSNIIFAFKFEKGGYFEIALI